MEKISKLLATTLAAALICGSLGVFASCDDNSSSTGSNEPTSASETTKPSESTSIPAAKKFTVTLTSNVESATLTGAGEYEEGAEATVSVTLPEGGLFLGWNTEDETLSKELSYTFTVGADVTMEATIATENAKWEAKSEWFMNQPLYFVGDVVKAYDYRIASLTDDRAEDVENFTEFVTVTKEGGETVTIGEDGYTLTEAGKYTIETYALKGVKYAKAAAYETTVVEGDKTAPEGMEFHNAAVVDGKYVVKRMTEDGSTGSISAEKTDFGYVAFKGEYGAGTWVSAKFTGKNRPNVGFFFDADSTMLKGSAENQGVYLGEFGTPYSRVFYNRFTSFDYASIAEKHDLTSNPTRPFTFDCRGNVKEDGTHDTSTSPNGVAIAYDQLDENKNYEMVIGMEAGGTNVVFHVSLFSIGEDGARTLVYYQNREINGYAKDMKGDITLYGSNLQAITFTAKLLSADEITEVKGLLK